MGITVHPQIPCRSNLDKMASVPTFDSTKCVKEGALQANSTHLNAKPKPRTAVNGRFAFEDLREIVPGSLEFGIGAPTFEMMAKLKPLLIEATKQRMVCGL